MINYFKSWRESDVVTYIPLYGTGFRSSVRVADELLLMTDEEASVTRAKSTSHSNTKISLSTDVFFIHLIYAFISHEIAFLLFFHHLLPICM